MYVKLFEEYSVEEIDLLLKDFTEVYSIDSIRKLYARYSYGSIHVEEIKRIMKYHHLMVGGIQK